MRERDRQRERDRETERDIKTQREREILTSKATHPTGR